MDDEKSSGKSFFHTLPGIITAIAGLITAVGGFVLILNKTGCVGTTAGDKEQHVKSNKSSENDSDANNDEDGPAQEKATFNKNNVAFVPASVKHLTRNLVYKIEDASAETLPAGEVVLNVKMKCTNNSDYEYHFYKNFLGIRINQDNHSPDPYSPSGNYQSVPPKSFTKLEYNFKLPRFTKTFNLDVYDVDDLIGSSAFTIK